LRVEVYIAAWKCMLDSVDVFQFKNSHLCTLSN